MGPELSAEERKALIREGLLRWHPDKFAQRFAARLPEDRAPVLARVPSAPPWPAGCARVHAARAAGPAIGA